MKSKPSKIRDGMDGTCESFMRYLNKEFRGHKSEISPHMLTKKAKLFANHYKQSDAVLLDALIRRGWLEPSAGNTYIINYWMVRK